MIKAPFRAITEQIHPDEECWGLAEGPLLLNMPGGGTQWRWIQEVTVIRGDAPAGWRQDFGPAEDFEDTVTPLLIPSFGENTVAELQARAERNRHDDYWIKRAQEMRESSTLMQDAVAQMEEIEKLRRNQTISGPYVKKQRNDYPVGLNRKQLKERKEERTGKRTSYPNGRS